MRFFLLALAIVLGGCATLIHGSSQSVRVESDSSGARVEVDGRPVGETPTTVQLERNQDHRVRVYREGREPHTVRLQQGRSIWAAVNLLNLIVPGVLVDLSTGAFYSLSPDPIKATFDEPTSPVADSSQSDP
ncbi:MAG: PEGA domain-containing protein [Salinibacter sp.]